MRDVWTIARREIHSAFSTPLFYLVCSGYLLLAGFFFFSLALQFNAVLEQAQIVPETSTSLNQWIITPWFQALEIVLVFFLPILTMRAIAEDRTLGTFELYMTSPVSNTSIIWGKFLGTAILAILILTAAQIYPLALAYFSDPELMPIVTGWLGQVLFSCALIALGVALSALTPSQTIAAGLSMAVFLLFYLINAPAERLGGRIGGILNYLAPGTHTELFFRGVIEGRDIVYLVSVLLFGLFFAQRILDAERWR